MLRIQLLESPSEVTAVRGTFLWRAGFMFNLLLCHLTFDAETEASAWIFGGLNEGKRYKKSLIYNI